MKYIIDDPLRRAIDLIELAARKREPFGLDHLRELILQNPEYALADSHIRWWISHALKVMVGHRLLRRIHREYGGLEYEPDALWGHRNYILGPWVGPTNHKARSQLDNHNRRRRINRERQRMQYNPSSQGEARV